MTVEQLRPTLRHWVSFFVGAEGLLPDAPGCYVVADENSFVLYIGKADRLSARVRTQLRRNFCHKTMFPCSLFFLEVPVVRVREVERGWLAQCYLEDGCLPPCNKIG